MPTTVPIPGGTAVLREPKELTVDGRDEIMLSMGQLDQVSAQAVVDAIENGNPAALSQLSIDQQRVMLKMPRAGVFAFLVSWTLPDPLPQSPADVGAMTSPVYDALRAHVDPRVSQVVTNTSRFDDPEGDPDTSPTGAFAGSAADSRAVKAPSDRRKPSTGRSTSTAAKSSRASRTKST